MSFNKKIKYIYEKKIIKTFMLSFCSIAITFLSGNVSLI